MGKYSKEAFIKEIDKLYPRLHRAMKAYLAGSNVEPEDILQEAFLKAYKNLENFKGNSNLYTWIYSIARNVSIDELRKQKHEKNRSSVPADEFELESDNFINESKKDEVLCLRKAISELPELLKSVVIMKAIDGLTYPEIEEITGVNEQTLKNRMFRARKILAESLIKMGLNT